MSREELQRRQEELLERADELLERADESEWSVLFTKLLDVQEEMRGATR